MDQKIINLFDEYTHKPLSRAIFIKKLSQLTGSTAAAMAILPLLEVNYANAATTPVNDNIITERVTYPGASGNMMGYLAKPKNGGPFGGVVVIHENRGLNPHIEDVARRVANEGFMALAPDALSPFGGTPEDADKARDLIGKLDADQNLTNFIQSVTYLGQRKDSNSKVGCVGFCWGGAMVNRLAVAVPTLKAASSFYGRQPDEADVSKIKASIQLHYAGLDERVNAGIPAYEAALKKAKVDYQLFMYEGVNHAFHNDTAPTRYNEEAAKLAWSRTMTLFKQKII